MRLLIVDDRVALVDVLANFLRAKVGPDGETFTVETETSYETAIELVKLAGNRLDAVLIDDRPRQAEPSLALEIIRVSARQRLIVIVITGGNDVQRCVHAMRAGASDYLEKASPEKLLEDITKSLGEAAKRLALYAPSSDAQWIDAHLKELMASHAGKFVVVHGGKVVESSDSYADVARVVRAFVKGAPLVCHVPG